MGLHAVLCTFDLFLLARFILFFFSYMKRCQYFEMGLWTAKISHKLLPLDYLVFVSYTGFFSPRCRLEYMYTQIFKCHMSFFNPHLKRGIFRTEIHWPAEIFPWCTINQTFHIFLIKRMQFLLWNSSGLRAVASVTCSEQKSQLTSPSVTRKWSEMETLLFLTSTLVFLQGQVGCVIGRGTEGQEIFLETAKSIWHPENKRTNLWHLFDICDRGISAAPPTNSWGIEEQFKCWKYEMNRAWKWLLSLLTVGNPITLKPGALLQTSGQMNPTLGVLRGQTVPGHLPYNPLYRAYSSSRKNYFSPSVFVLEHSCTQFLSFCI